jgi:replication fork clamp-binding protein CrfC
MMTFITSWFDRVERSLGLTALQRFFPEYLQTTGMIAEVQDKISLSRGDRNALRDSMYDEIDKADGPYDQVLGLFGRMKQSNARVAHEVRNERIEKVALWAVSIVGIVLAVVGLIAAWYFWKFPVAP